MTALLSDPLVFLLMACTGAAVWATAVLVLAVLLTVLAYRAAIATARLTTRAILHARRTCRRHLPRTTTRQETT